MNKAQILVQKLPLCRQISHGKWIGPCPAHPDRTPSLSITELDDHRVLIHCHAGCTPQSVMSAIGLNMSDLFPDDLSKNYSPIVRKRERDITDDLIVEIARNELKSGAKLTESEKEEVLKAAVRRMRR